MWQPGVGVNEGGPATVPRETHWLAPCSLFPAMIMKRITVCIWEDSLVSTTQEDIQRWKYRKPLRWYPCPLTGTFDSWRALWIEVCRLIMWSQDVGCCTSMECWWVLYIVWILSINEYPDKHNVIRNALSEFMITITFDYGYIGQRSVVSWCSIAFFQYNLFQFHSEELYWHVSFKNNIAKALQHNLDSTQVQLNFSSQFTVAQSLWYRFQPNRLNE